MILSIDKIAGRRVCERRAEKQVLFNWVKKRASLDALIGNHAVGEEHAVKDYVEAHVEGTSTEHMVCVPLADKICPCLGKFAHCKSTHNSYLSFLVCFPFVSIAGKDLHLT